MKTLFLIRHAKSSWGDHSHADFDRPLNERGLRDAPFMAELLRKEGVRPDLMIVSPARRTTLTAQFFGKALGIEEADFQFNGNIYEASTRQIFKIINGIEAAANTVLLIGHNPAMTDMANYFSKKFVDNVPTCGIIRIEAAIEDWADFSPENASVTALFFPGNYLPGSID